MARIRPPHVYYLSGVRPVNLFAVPTWPAQCKSCGHGMMAYALLGDFVELLHHYYGEDLFCVDTGFCCSPRLTRALRILPGLEFMRLEARYHGYSTIDTTPGIKRPKFFWLPQINSNVADMAIVEGGRCCRDCGWREWVSPRGEGEPFRPMWEYWRPQPDDWDGSPFFWLVSQNLDRLGPLITQPALDVIEDFNLGTETQIHEVQWHEE
ncbi:MAG TPA: hypothetical protein PL033_20065 [Candidatus Brocadiia bacterium]|nr:hypothetical protein [Candidatus Brocadiia bacterium]